MSNQNIADISAFEQLQNQNNTSFGSSQMSVFNDLSQEDEKLKKDYLKAIGDLSKAAAEFAKADKEYRKFNEICGTFQKETIKRQWSRSQDPDIKKANNETNCSSLLFLTLQFNQTCIC